MSEELQQEEQTTVAEEQIEQAEVGESPELAALKEELAAQNDKYLRLMAEYENFRRRAQKDRENTYADAYADVLKEILPVVDNLERALQFSEGAQLAQGVQMTYAQFLEAMKHMGIEQIETTTFDPNVHNAVMHVEDETKGEGEIVEVFQKGYKKGERVLRFAMVKVAN